MERVILSTGDIKMDYEIVDIVFAYQAIGGIALTQAKKNFQNLLPELNEKLRQTAIKKGCDAVIWIQYNPPFVSQYVGYHFLTAWGTGVKIK